MKYDILLKETRYPGYGCPPSWRVDAIYSNRLLETMETDSPREHGIAVAELRAKWLCEWTAAEFEGLLEAAPLASRVCDHCGGDTLAGGISCVNKTFCTKCEPHIEQYKKAYQAEMDEHRRVGEARATAREAEEKAAVKAATKDAFYWRDNWFFKRMPDGTVRIMHPSEDERYLSTDLVISMDEWDSITDSLGSKE